MTDTTQAAALPELLPCPFCGAQPLVNVIEPHDHALAIDGFKMPRHEGSCVIECGCGAGLIDATQEAVTARWNQRSSTALQEAERERDALRLQEQVLRGGIASLAAVLGITDAAQMDWVGDTARQPAQALLAERDALRAQVSWITKVADKLLEGAQHAQS